MPDTPDVLKKILARKLEEITAASEQTGLRELSALAAGASRPRGFIESLNRQIDNGNAAVIAEIKKACLLYTSPSPRDRG